jgi:hypothetical protein
MRKVGEISGRPTGLSSRLQALLREEAKNDYFRFRACIEYAIELLDVNDGYLSAPKLPSI